MGPAVSKKGGNASEAELFRKVAHVFARKAIHRRVVFAEALLVQHGAIAHNARVEIDSKNWCTSLLTSQRA